MLEATLFAPDDAAFVTLLENLNMTAADLLGDVELLTTVLSYHVVTGVAAKAADLKDGQKLPTMLDNETLEVGGWVAGCAGRPMVLECMMRGCCVLLGAADGGLPLPTCPLTSPARCPLAPPARPRRCASLPRATCAS